MDYRMRVDPEHFEYLRLQKGSLDKYTHDPHQWHRAYEADLRETYGQVAPFLPKVCEAVLDVGSGLGGIDALLFRHYQADGQRPLMSLLDGVDDPPVMRLHRETFNDMRMARNFLCKNGVNPLAIGYYGPGTVEFATQFDLVVSFGSWCFHYPPRQYLAAVRAACKPSTVLVLDVRAEKPDWHDELKAAGLELFTMVAVKPKWSRCVFHVAAPK